MHLFRVVPYVTVAKTGEPGHPLFVSPLQGAGRIDNPDRYSTLYLGNSPAGAVAEVFGNLPAWTSDMFHGPPALPTSLRALASYELDDAAPVLNLDDPQVLLDRTLRPSTVITRDRDVTQAWARRVFAESSWCGVAWWSYWEATWASFGLWDIASLTLAGVEQLTRDHPAVQEATDRLDRSWIP